MCISKPLSSGPLGLLVLGDLPTDLVQVAHSVERFQARWKLSGDPLLLQATLRQIGAQPVTKFVPAECTPVDVLPSALVRVAVFRDEWGQPWADFVKAPLRAVVAQCKLLTSCSVAGCTCEAFHGVSGPGEPEPILEVFGRQFLQLNLRQATPGEAQVFKLFNAVLRIPLALEERLQGLSGVGGIYFEPRGESLRDPSTRFCVVWIPRADHKQALLIKQGNTEVVGLARIGGRYGVRCKAAAAKTLHEQLKPDQPFLAGGGLSQYHVGPWPHGTQRSAVMKALKAFGWTASATQPVIGAPPGGTWWHVQASVSPPSKVIHSEVGDILIVNQPSKSGGPRPEPPVIASKAVLQQLQAGPPTVKSGPVETTPDDPWATYLRRRSASSDAMSSQAVDKVAQKVIGQIQSGPAPLTAETFQHMAAQLRQEVLYEVASVAQRVDGQESMLRSMFQEQMSRIEELMAPKRARQE